MFGFLENLCSCFSPEIKQNIIEYLSSSQLNRQVIEEEKCSQQTSPSQSIYAQAKMKSYYFMKLKQQETEDTPTVHNQEKQEYDQSVEPNYYPTQSTSDHASYDDLYAKKLNALRKILREEMGSQFSKIYDSQDDLNLKIYCKQQIYALKRFNSYRFSFQVHNQALQPLDFLKIDSDKSALHHPLMSQKQLLSKTDKQLELNHRYYKKILVIHQHDFYTAEKGELIENDVYYTCFSIKGEWQKGIDYKRGWINLSGLRVCKQSGEEDEGEGVSTSLRQEEGYLRMDGYLNVELQLSVNANMLKQPIAKEIRIYVQKLVCSLTQSDAI